MEEWEERRSDEAEGKTRFQDDERRENLLLELVQAYQEQFWNLRRFAEARDSDLAEQLGLMETNLRHAMQMCGISIIGECGLEIYYDLHEIVEVLDTPDSRLHGIVATVYSCGCLYRGKVKRKARVAVYRAE